MNALLQAKLTQELKDSMVGHKREGARNDYAITELTVKTAYLEAFKFLTINGYGSQSRKLEEIATHQEQSERQFTEQLKALTELITELRSDNKTLKQQIADNKNAMDKQIAIWEKQYNEERKETKERLDKFLSCLPLQAKVKAINKLKEAETVSKT
jgi:predicted RNase H-like nuclease (RuvC/YqgF family)